MPLSSWPVVQPIVDKGKLYRTCQAQNFPIPKTWFISSEEDLQRQRAAVTFPCIVKPTFSTQFRKRFGVKAVRFDGFDQLKEFVALLLKEGIDFVVQEFIAMTQNIRAVEAALGSGIKIVSPAEQQKAQQYWRSLHAARDLPAGTDLTVEDIAVVRPNDGLPPSLLQDIVGMKLCKPLKAGQPITFKAFDQRSL